MTEPDPLTPLLDLVARRRPALLHKDVHTARAWLAAGCDVARDVVPTVSGLLARYPDIQTFNYFTKAVHRARDLRLAAEASARARAAAPTGDALAAKARRIAWLRDCVPQKYAFEPALQAWLAAYEAEHGPVPPTPEAARPRARTGGPP